MAVVQEFAPNWRILAAATLGVSMSVTAIPLYTLGVFLLPLEAARGWSRTDIALAPAILGFSLPLGFLMLGRLIARFGIRRVAVSGHLMLAFAFIGLSQAATLSLFWGLYFFAGLAAVGASPVTYTQAVVRAFETRRGLAIGLCMSGAGVGAVLAPPILDYVLRVHGWQAGYAVLGSASALVGAAVHRLLARIDTGRDGGRREIGSAASNRAGAADLPAQGDLHAEGGGTRLLVMLCAIIFVVALCLNGYVVHLVPILVAQGHAARNAAALAGGIGLAVMVGRLVTGWLLDRFSTGLVGGLVFSGAAVGIALLAEVLPAPPLAAVLLIGFSIGAEVDILAYIVSRRFSAADYARRFSWVYGAFMVGGGISPLLAGLSYDLVGGYGPFFLVSALLLLGVAASFVGLEAGRKLVR